jgi:hypothetical protein
MRVRVRVHCGIEANPMRDTTCPALEHAPYDHCRAPLVGVEWSLLCTRVRFVITTDHFAVDRCTNGEKILRLDALSP